MDEPKPLLRDPKRQTLLVALVLFFGFIAYLAMLGRQGTARDVLYADHHAYVSMGEVGGLEVISTTLPSRPVLMGTYPNLGPARKLALVNKLLYVANGSRGLTILSVEDPAHPRQVGSLSVPGDVYDVAVLDKYAYLAAGPAGLQIVDISNPTQPRWVGGADTSGNAQGIGIYQVSGLAQGNNPDNPNSGAGGRLKGIYVCIADGIEGLEIFDVQVPQAPAFLGNAKVQDNAQKVVLVDRYAFVAAGKVGVRVVDVFNPAAPRIIGGYAETDGFANDVKMNGTYAYIAFGKLGLRVVNFQNLQAPASFIRFSEAGNAQAIAIEERFAYLASGEQGFQVVDMLKPGAPVIIGHIETPGEASIWQILTALKDAATGNLGQVQEKVWHALGIMAFDGVLFAVVLVFWLGFYAQFVLPVHSLQDRGRVIERLMTYIQGGHGPAVFIQNGKEVKRENEEKRHGPGVMLLDTASAAVLRSAHAFTRAVGPGTVFTASKESIAGVVDLHRQTTNLGPGEGRHPFRPKGEKETEEAYQARQRERDETSALTRDGVEVVPSVSVTFGLKSEPGAGRSQFGFTPQSVWCAIARSAIEIKSDGSHDNYDWTKVTARLAVDLWREYLRKFTLDDLFSFGVEPGAISKKTDFDRIVENIRARLTNAEVSELDAVGQPTTKILKSKEYQVLQERGIVVYSVNIRNLQFPPAIEDKLVQQWKATWFSTAQLELRDADRQQAEEKEFGKQEALELYAHYASQMLYAELAHKRSPISPETLKKLVEGTVALCLREPELSARLTTQKDNLLAVIEWIEK